MANERKITLLYWIVAILVVFNLSLLATVVFYPRLAGNLFHHPKFQGPGMNKGDQRHFLTTALDLTPEQELLFDSSRRQFFREADTVFKALNQFKGEMYKELSAENPDSIKLKGIATQMGLLHTQLKLSTISHFLMLRKECRPDQQKKLSEIFGRMINSPVGYQGGGRRMHESRKPIPEENN